MCLLLLWLTLSAGTLVSGEKSEPCPDTARLTCGEATYNPLSQSCCQGVINSLANMTHPDCCAKKAYDRLTHLCCRHNAKADITDVSKMKQPECCGTKAFDVTLQKCCSADVTDSMPIVYQPQSQSCKHEAKVARLAKFVLYDIITAECGCGVNYDPKRQKCCPGNVVVDIPANTTHPHCCGKTVYDQHTHKCCDGKTYDISGTVQPSCCGPSGTFYDKSVELCCDGEKKYFHGLASPACCGKEAFDKETHNCADGKVTARPDVKIALDGLYMFFQGYKAIIKDLGRSDHGYVPLEDCSIPMTTVVSLRGQGIYDDIGQPYFCGGYDNKDMRRFLKGTAVSRCWGFDFSTKKFEVAASMEYGVLLPSSAVVPGQNLLWIVGGTHKGGQEIKNRTSFFDPNGKSVQLGPLYDDDIYGHCMVGGNHNQVIVTGGLVKYAPKKFVTLHTFEFDKKEFKSGTTTALAPMKRATFLHACAKLDNEIVVFGGMVPEAMNLDSGAWRDLPDLPEKWVGYSFIFFPYKNDMLVLVGGSNREKVKEHLLIYQHSTEKFQESAAGISGLRPNYYFHNSPAFRLNDNFKC